MSNQSKFKMIENAVRIGGKGSMRRKHKRIPNSGPKEARRLQATLGKLSLFQMTGVVQLTLLMDDQSEMVISMPHVQGSISSNLFVVSGKPTHVEREPWPGSPPSPCPSPPPPPPPPPPSPAFNKRKSGKKPKKPRNRVRLRNKCVREMFLADGGAGNFGEANGLGSVEDLFFSPSFLVDGGGGDSEDSDRTTVPSFGSDMNLTIVGADSLERLCERKESGEPQTGGEDGTQDPEVDSEENGEKDTQENVEDYDEGECEDFMMTLDDLMSCLGEN